MATESDRENPQVRAGYQLADEMGAMLTFKLVRIGRIVDRVTSRLAKLEGMTVNDFKLLTLIARRRTTSIREAIENTTIDQGNTSKSVQSLTRQGLIRSVNDPSDKRKRRLEVTGKGLDVIESVFPVRMQFDDKVAGLFTREELDQLDEALTKILATVDHPHLLDEIEINYENMSTW